MENSEKTIDVLNDLVKINNDRVAGFDLGQYRQRVYVGGVDDVADVDLTEANNAVDPNAQPARVASAERFQESGRSGPMLVYSQSELQERRRGSMEQMGRPADRPGKRPHLRQRLPAA